MLEVSARAVDPDFRWTSVRASDLNLLPVRDGCIPDLNILDRETALETRRRNAKHLLPTEIEAVVEVTSRWNAGNDRPPKLVRPVKTKWSNYAASGIPFYLLVDRDPRSPGVTLYGEPDVQLATYRALHTWKFGASAQLPEPFSFEVDTSLWTPWDE